MIQKESFMLFDKLVKDNKYQYLLDISIIYRCEETCNACDLDSERMRKTGKFYELCEEVKRQYLKYDVELNDDLIFDVLKKIDEVQTYDFEKDEKCYINENDYSFWITNTPNDSYSGYSEKFGCIEELKLAIKRMGNNYQMIYVSDYDEVKK